MIQSERIRVLNDRPERSGKYVLYWMQAAQRAYWNDALEFSIIQANRLALPICVYFGVTSSFPEANQRHFRFMFDGLAGVYQDLKDRQIPMIIRIESPVEGVLALARDAALLVCDMGYLRIQRHWRQTVAEKCDIKVYQIETESIIPVETASDHDEYSAATLRRKLQSQFDRFIVESTSVDPKIRWEGPNVTTTTPAALITRIDDLPIDRTVIQSSYMTGGRDHADRLLNRFVLKIEEYAEKRNDPSNDAQSGLSPYLHFGQIASREIAHRIRSIPGEGAAAFLEELIVRRELAFNFVFYCPTYDSYDGLPTWARNSLQRHMADLRPSLYSLDSLEAAQTHDPYWNAAQLQMRITGKMHGYMRMYWGKKILEWMETPQMAFQTLLFLNNKYEIDGRDPNGFAGVAWCFGKHDRPWAERAVFGNIRYMNAAGLERKFDIHHYVKAINELINPEDP